MAIFLVGHDRGVWLEFNMTCKFCTSNWNIKWKLILIYLTSNKFKVYYFEKSGSFVIKFSLIQSGSISNQCCDIADCTLKLYYGFGSSGIIFFLFWHLWLFHLVVSCCYLLPNHYPCDFHIPFEYSFHSHYSDFSKSKVSLLHWSSEWIGKFSQPVNIIRLREQFFYKIFCLFLYILWKIWVIFKFF